MKERMAAFAKQMFPGFSRSKVLHVGASFAYQQAGGWLAWSWCISFGRLVLGLRFPLPPSFAVVRHAQGMLELVCHWALGQTVRFQRFPHQQPDGRVRKHLHQLPRLILSQAELEFPCRRLCVFADGQGVELGHQVDVAQGLQHIGAKLVHMLQSQRPFLAGPKSLVLVIPLEVGASLVRQQHQVLLGHEQQLRFRRGSPQLVQLLQKRCEDHLHELEPQRNHGGGLIGLLLGLVFLGPCLRGLHEEVKTAVAPFVAEKEKECVLFLQQLHFPVQLQGQFCQLCHGQCQVDLGRQRMSGVGLVGSVFFLPLGCSFVRLQLQRLVDQRCHVLEGCPSCSVISVWSGISASSIGATGSFAKDNGSLQQMRALSSQMSLGDLEPSCRSVR